MHCSIPVPFLPDAATPATVPPSSSPRYPRQAAPPWRPGLLIHHGAPCQRLLQGASASRSTTVPLPGSPPRRLGQQHLLGAPASNKPHPAEKSTPAWLAISVSPPNEAVAWPCSPFLQFTARANPCSRHLWGTLARAVASICAHRARPKKLIVWL